LIASWPFYIFGVPMSNIKLNILEKVELKSEKALSWLLDDCMNRRTVLNTMPGMENTFEFKYQKFLKGIDVALNGVPKSEVSQTAVKVLCAVFEEFEIDVTEPEAFIIYTIRDLGKFRTKDKKLLPELKGYWGTLKEYTLDDSEFAVTLRELKNVGLIDFRRGAITLPENFVVRPDL
jgi:hypothetical protein